MTNILDATGRPMTKSPKMSAKSSMQFENMNSWISSLAKTSLPPLARAADPFGNHAWVFAAAMTTAIVASQAPFTVMRETDEQLEERRRVSLKRYNRWRGPTRGSRRRAVARHIMKGGRRRLWGKALEPDYDHELTNLLLNPNPYQSGNQLWQMTHLWMALRGEVFWVLEDDDGGSPIGEMPERIWPLSPDLFQPILEHGQWGPLIGWEFTSPKWMEKRGKGWKIALPLSDVIQFKFPNPENPLRGLSRLGAVAMGIEMDMLVKEYNKKIIENGGDPGGVITYDADLEADEETEFIEKWESRHGGSYNARRTALLSGGFKYSPIALTPKEMEWLQQQEWDREEVLAVMNVPRSVLGVPDQNYATQLGQDANFWDKNLLPLMQLEETTLDGTLFFEQPDDVVGVFDVTDIEALRAGVHDKVKIAIDMSGDVLHVPPRTAFDIVGLDVPEYEGDELALVKPILTTVEDVLADDPEPPEEPFPPEVEPEDEDVEEEPTIPDEEEDASGSKLLTMVGHGMEVEEAVSLMRCARSRRMKKEQDEFEALETTLENLMKGRYRTWVLNEKNLHMTALANSLRTLGLRWCDMLAKESLVANDLIAALPPLPDTKKRLKKKVRPLYPTAVESTIDMTMTEIGGVPVFEIDDPVFFDVMEKREQTFVHSTPETLRGKLIKEIIRAVDETEDVQTLRTRVANVFNISSSSAKSLQVSRTEMASLMNDTRDKVFEAQGITVEAWSTSRDEHVRKTHQTYGKLKPKKRGYNYLEASGKEGSGRLEFPGDTRCSDVSELISCRCKKSAIK